MVSLRLTFEEPPNCFPQQLHHFTFSLAMHEGSNFSTSLELFTFHFYLLEKKCIITILMNVKWYFIVVLIRIFPSDDQ